MVSTMWGQVANANWLLATKHNNNTIVAPWFRNKLAQNGFPSFPMVCFQLRAPQQRLQRCFRTPVFGDWQTGVRHKLLDVVPQHLTANIEPKPQANADSKPKAKVDPKPKGRKPQVKLLEGAQLDAQAARGGRRLDAKCAGYWQALSNKRPESAMMPIWLNTCVCVCGCAKATQL